MTDRPKSVAQVMQHARDAREGYSRNKGGVNLTRLKRMAGRGDKRAQALLDELGTDDAKTAARATFVEKATDRGLTEAEASALFDDTH